MKEMVFSWKKNNKTTVKKVFLKVSINWVIPIYRNTPKNPYVFKVNCRLVKVEFADNGRKAEDAITNVIKILYR